MQQRCLALASRLLILPHISMHLLHKPLLIMLRKRCRYLTKLLAVLLECPYLQLSLRTQLSCSGRLPS